jgi:hypothetical protein
MPTQDCDVCGRDTDDKLRATTLYHSIWISIDPCDDEFLMMEKNRNTDKPCASLNNLFLKRNTYCSVCVLF